jgi:hypothetical protein
MAKILITIPHYYRAQAAASTHASERGDAGARAAVVADAIGSLWANLSGRTTIVETKSGGLVAGPKRHQADIRIVTAGSDHLVDSLQRVHSLFRQVPVAVANPRLLGFECHRVLAAEIENFDWFAYLEDDLILHDQLLIEKLEWFNRLFGGGNTLQPNRYEAGYGYSRFYIDGPGRWKQIGNNPAPETLEAEFLGRPLRFELASNPHSGCFFLTRGQMRRWMRAPAFLDGDTSFVGPLESAATLGLYKTFRVYKTAAANYDFVEIRHAGDQYLRPALAKRLRSQSLPRQAAHES